MALPLEGVRILDFTWVVAGPVATRILADHGADTIKVERSNPAPLGNRKAGMQLDLHRGKRSIAINMGNPNGVELARRLAAKSDVVIDNFSARVMRSWGMDYQSLTKVRPDIISVSMSGLGHTGPRASYVSYGPTLQALGGYTALMTDTDGRPAGYGYSYADMSGGYTGALAVLIALWHRRRTGQGQFIDLSQFEAVCAVIGPSLLDIAANGREQKPQLYNSQESPAAPHGVYRCASRGTDNDRWIAIAAHTQRQWQQLAEAIGAPPWTRDPKFATLYLRMRNREELDSNLGRWTATVSAEDAMLTLQRAGVPAGVVANGEDMCARDPHLQAREFWAPLRGLDGKTTHVTGIPFRLSSGSGEIRALGPNVGEHTDDVLGEILGVGRAERDELVRSGALWG